MLNYLNPESSVRMDVGIFNVALAVRAEETGGTVLHCVEWNEVKLLLWWFGFGTNDC